VRARPESWRARKSSTAKDRKDTTERRSVVPRRTQWSDLCIFRRRVNETSPSVFFLTFENKNKLPLLVEIVEHGFGFQVGKSVTLSRS